MTINDMPTSEKRYLCYDWYPERVPSYTYIKQLIQYAAHFKFNGIVFINDSLSAPFDEMELFYLKKFAKTYYIDIVTGARRLSNINILNVNLKHKIYPEFQQPIQTIFSSFAADDNKLTLFHNTGAALFIDNWYSMFWTAEMLWYQPKNNSSDLLEQRRMQFEKSLDRQFFEVDFPLSKQLRSFDSLHIISLSNRDFWESVKTTNLTLAHNPANNRFVLDRALALENTLQLLLDSLPIAHDEIIYSMIFATQRSGFIALKNLLQESLAQQRVEPEAIQETLELLLQNIIHLKKAHETLWKI
jgi:hypothetical protein